MLFVRIFLASIVRNASSRTLAGDTSNQRLVLGSVKCRRAIFSKATNFSIVPFIPREKSTLTLEARLQDSKVGNSQGLMPRELYRAQASIMTAAAAVCAPTRGADIRVGKAESRW